MRGEGHDEHPKNPQAANHAQGYRYTADASIEVSPLPLPGPYAVACSDIAQDFNRVASDEGASDYWQGNPRPQGASRYVTDLLAEVGRRRRIVGFDLMELAPDYGPRASAQFAAKHCDRGS